MYRDPTKQEVGSGGLRQGFRLAVVRIVAGRSLHPKSPRTSPTRDLLSENWGEAALKSFYKAFSLMTHTSGTLNPETCWFFLFRGLGVHGSRFLALLGLSRSVVGQDLGEWVTFYRVHAHYVWFRMAF